MLLGLVSAAAVLLRAVDVSTARIERIDDLGRAMDAIRHDIAQISRARWNGTEPQTYVFRGGPNSLYFAHATRMPGGARTSEAVALREIVTVDGPTLMRATARLPARATSFDDLTFGPARDMWTGVARLRFAYVPQSEGKAEEPPRSSWPVGIKLPAAILVEAVDRDTRRVLVATRVTIEANADIGCLGDSDPAPAPAGTAAQADPATQGAGGVDFGPLQQAAPLPPPVAQPGASQQPGDDGAFCSRAADGGDKAKAPPPPGTGTPAPEAPL